MLTRIIIFLVLLFNNKVLAELPLVEYNPQGARNGPTILEDITSRCTPDDIQRGYDNDPETRTHELQHQLNSRIRNIYGGTGNVNSVYLGKGYAWVMKEPKVTLSQVAQNVADQYKNSTYKLYLIDQQRYWQNEPLYITDELSAYYAGALYARQAGIKDHGSRGRFISFLHYTEALISTIKQRDPNYQDLQALINLLEFYKERNGELDKYENFFRRNHRLQLPRIRIIN